MYDAGLQDLGCYDRTPLSACDSLLPKGWRITYRDSKCFYVNDLDDSDTTLHSSIVESDCGKYVTLANGLRFSKRTGKSVNSQPRYRIHGITKPKYTLGKEL